MVICIPYALRGGLRRLLRSSLTLRTSPQPNMLAKQPRGNVVTRTIHQSAHAPYAQTPDLKHAPETAVPAAREDSRCYGWYLARLSHAGRGIYCTIGCSDGVSQWDLSVIQRAGFVRAFQDHPEKTSTMLRFTLALGHKIWQYIGPLWSGDIPPVSCCRFPRDGGLGAKGTEIWHALQVVRLQRVCFLKSHFIYERSPK